VDGYKRDSRLLWASKYGAEDIGSPAAETLPMRYGPNISRTRQRPSWTMIFKAIWCVSTIRVRQRADQSGFKP